MKLNELKNILSSMESVVVAYSGGLDSTFLLKVAKDVLKDKVIAVTAVSPVYAEDEISDAKKFASELGVKHLLIETRELNDAKFSNNPVDRCYWCKKELFQRLLDIVRSNGFNYVVDGSNLDDLNDYRPGSRAAKELGVRSPLLEAGLTKDDIRKMSRDMGLPTWDKPSMACLASRFPYGAKITTDDLKKIETAEKYIRSKGFLQVRVRHYNDTARIEVFKEDVSRLTKIEKEISDKLKGFGYKNVTIDPNGYRTGSMNV